MTHFDICVSRHQWRFMVITISVNSLGPERCGNNFKSVVSEIILPIKFTSTSLGTLLWRISQNNFHHKSTLVQAMAWQAPSYCLRKCVCVFAYVCRNMTTLSHNGLISPSLWFDLYVMRLHFMSCKMLFHDYLCWANKKLKINSNHTRKLYSSRADTSSHDITQ